ncbi:MAG: hypothetical protein GY719_10510 [bacterium]|nr:hypothetical protein [bacterium]
MRSPAAAIAWEICRGHRWGLAGLALYFAVLAVVRFLVLGSGQSLAQEEVWQFALAVPVPLGATVTYFLAIFSFGLGGDLSARESMYPARMFTLPVTSAALAGWPMLYGSVAMAGMWLVTRSLALWPADVDIPWLWPALLAAVFIAWTQALTWIPYPFRGLRVAVIVSWLSVIGFSWILAIELEVPENVILALLAPQLPLAYLVARFGVVRGRRGDVPDWRHVLPRALRRQRGSAEQRHWPSAAHAQGWLEWRRYGRSLPILVGILLPFELLLLFVFDGTTVFISETLGAVLITPPFMATFVAASVRSDPGGRDAYELTPFLATRPLTNAALIRAKVEATVRSTLATWLLVLLTTALALTLSDTWPAVFDASRRLAEAVGTPRAVAIGLLGLAALVASTWKQLVQGLYLGLSGRAWLVKASVSVNLSVLTVLVVLVPWVLRRGSAIRALWQAFPWILAVLVCLKVAAAAWIAVRLHDNRLLRDRTLVLGAFSWSVAVFALYSLLVWLAPPVLFHAFLLLLVAILAVPLARLSAAPLALSGNRHQ